VGRILGCPDGCANTKSLWFASDTLFEQDETLASVRMLPMDRPDGHKEKSTLTSVKFLESLLSQYIADLALYNSFHSGINILQ
jgi:hypothetical protein